jgi:hypothetical protein
MYRHFGGTVMLDILGRTALGAAVLIGFGLVLFFIALVYMLFAKIGLLYLVAVLVFFFVAYALGTILDPYN